MPRVRTLRGRDDMRDLPGAVTQGCARQRVRKAQEQSFSIIPMPPRANYQNEGSSANGSSSKDWDVPGDDAVTAYHLPWSGKSPQWTAQPSFYMSYGIDSGARLAKIGQEPNDR
jgi:hypothetical protein